MSFTAAFTPAPASLPPDVDLDEVLADVADDHVSAPTNEVPGLKLVVAEANSDGVELTIVVVEANPGHDSMLRDLATEVGKHEGGTVLVLSPDWVGTYSDSISRVELETAEDPAKWHNGDSVAASHKFVDELTNYSLPWSAMSCAILVVTLAAMGGLYVVKSRRAAVTETPDTPDSADPR